MVRPETFGPYYVHPFVRISWLNWTDHINRMDSKRKVKYLTIILREFDYEDDQNIDGGTAYKQILVNAKLQSGKRGKKKRPY